MQELIVSDLFSPMRLDRYLRQSSYDLSQGIIEKYLRKGGIKLNGKKAKSSERVNNGDIISYKADLELGENNHAMRISFSPAIISLAEKLQTEYLIFEDEKILVIDKPDHLAVQGGTNIPISVDDGLQYLNSQGQDLRICHRLDRDTSGLLLIAKNRLVATQIMNGFKENQIHKQYLAIVSGHVDHDRPTIKSHLSLAKNKAGERVQVNNEQAADNTKHAVTNWYSLAMRGNLHLLQMEPQTGRMHQLRCHSLLVSDGIIGDRKYYPQSIKEFDTQHMMLHAYKMALDKEILGKEYQFEAPVPEYFTRYLKQRIGISEIPDMQ